MLFLGAAFIGLPGFAAPGDTFLIRNYQASRADFRERCVCTWCHGTK